MSDTLVCMVRSAGSGRAPQERSVVLALENDFRLIFLHVINMNEMPFENNDLCNAATEEMTWLGNMTLSLAQKRAWQKGVKSNIEIRYGSVFEEACSFLREVQACLLVLGSPHPQVEDYDDHLAQITQFAERITQETGIPVEIVTRDQTPVKTFRGENSSE